MKIRSGFVTNSSSTSFVVVFDEMPKDVEDLCKKLFGDVKSVYGSRGTISTMNLASVVFDDIKTATPNDINRIRSHDCKIPGSPDQEDFLMLNGHYNEERYEKAANKFYQEFIDNILKKNKNAKIFCLEYSDEGGNPLDSYLRSNDVFDNFQHWIGAS